ncbi:ParA family protein [Haloterrigena salinisoli]|uniref:ParA family protein n=1 Tax=Haloterrigena salinisoli TaxID=3132747 RepID=UPI0030CF0ECF
MVIATVIYSESGGTFKTTTTANLAVSLERMGLDVCLIDLDPQEGNLTNLFDVGAHRSDLDADNLVKHILDGDFEDLIEISDKGVDVLPNHDMLGDFTSNLEQKIAYETGMKNIDREITAGTNSCTTSCGTNSNSKTSRKPSSSTQTLGSRTCCTTPSTAMRTLVAPVKPAEKGNLSLDGLEEMVENMESKLGIEVGLSCVVPTAIGQTNARSQYTK